MGADFCGIERGGTVAVWGCGGVGLMAQKSAFLLGAERVIAIDRFPERLRMAREQVGSESLDAAGQQDFQAGEHHDRWKNQEQQAVASQFPLGGRLAASSLVRLDIGRVGGSFQRSASRLG